MTNTPSSYSFSVDFGGDKVANQEKIMSIIHNIANLRDHLKNNIAEAEVKNHFYSDINLKIIMDLSNADKHGYPTRDNNSKLNPKIEKYYFCCSVTRYYDDICIRWYAFISRKSP